MASFRQKVGSFIAGKKSFIDGTPFSLRSAYNVLASMLSTVWGRYSNTKLINEYHTMAEVYSPVYHRASRVSQIAFVVKKRSNDEVVYDNKDLNRLLERPNELMNWQEFLYQWEAYECVTGMNFIYANVPDLLKFDYKNVISLRNLPADQVEIKKPYKVKVLTATQITDLITSFNVSYGNTIEPIAPAKVLYTKVVSLYASDLNIEGRSPLLANEKAIDNLKLVYGARNTVYKKSGARGFLTSRKADADGVTNPLTATEKKEINEQYEKDYGVTDGKSPVGIISAPVDFVKVGLSIAEMQPFDETLACAMAIYQTLNVPRSLMPTKEGSTYANTKEEEKAFYVNVIIPSAKKKAQSLTNFLQLDQVGLYIDVDFSHIDVLQENKKEKAEVDWRNNETYRVRFDNGVCTLNDWVVACGLEAVKLPIYDKRIPEMDESELAIVEKMKKMTKGGSSSAGSDNNQNGNNDSNKS